MTDEEVWAGTSLIKFDRDDWDILCKLSEREKLPKTEIIRRALRERAQLALRDDSSATAPNAARA